jgi:Fe2+ transport system protein FeoA
MSHTLNKLSVGGTATIDDIVSGHSHSNRLKSMGFQTGKRVQVLRQTSHVMHVRVGSTEWAIRNQDAELINIIPENPSKVHGRDC